MENSNIAKADKPRRFLPFVLLATLLLACSYFFWDEAFQTSFAGVAALIAIPATIGGLLSHIVDPDGKTVGIGCFAVPTIAILAMVIVAFFVMGEGAVCIAMILPIWIPAAITGYLVHFWNARRTKKSSHDKTIVHSFSWALVPFFLVVVEQLHPPEWHSKTVVSYIEVNAPVEAIWPLLTSIPEIQANEGEANFTQDVLGVPRPLQARLSVESDRLVRKASWGGGIRFEEKIDRAIPNKLIEWTFAFPDNSIERYVDRHVSPQGGILQIQTGGYYLDAPAPDVTRIRLITRYRMRTRLPMYLALWGDQMLGDIQNNVLTIVKQRAERMPPNREAGT